MPRTADELRAEFGEPDTMSDDTSNRVKVGWAFTALLAFFKLINSEGWVPTLDEAWEGTDAESAISDLIADLLILAEFKGLDPHYLHYAGWRDFQAEIGHGFDGGS